MPVYEINIERLLTDSLNSQPSSESLVLSMAIKIIGNKIGKDKIGKSEFLVAALVIIAESIVVDEAIAKLPKRRVVI